MSSILYYEPFYSLDYALQGLLESALKSRRTTDAASHVERHHPNAASIWKPRMDFHQDEGKNLVTMTVELPGLKKEDVALEISDDGSLKICAESKPPANYEESGYIVRERRFGKFSGSYKLPLGIKEGVTATMVDGLLTITFPQRSPEREPRKIPIE